MDSICKVQGLSGRSSVLPGTTFGFSEGKQKPERARKRAWTTLDWRLLETAGTAGPLSRQPLGGEHRTVIGLAVFYCGPWLN